MIVSARPLRLRLAGAAVALLLGTAPVMTATAWAQGTAEQREACAPDAINLCSDTIPDETKTKACMQRHLSQLSPRCRTVFLEATRPPEGAAAPPPDESTAPTPAAVQVLPPPAGADDPLANYRASIAQDCRQGLIDPFTCKNTLAVLGGP